MTSERLLIYPPKDSDSREKSVLVLFFGISAFFVGLFSITRLFRVHWVFLVPLSLGSLALFMVAVLFFRMREKPLKALWVEGDSLCILLDPGTPGHPRADTPFLRYAWSPQGKECRRKSGYSGRMIRFFPSRLSRCGM